MNTNIPYYLHAVNLPPAIQRFVNSRAVIINTDGNGGGEGDPKKTEPQKTDGPTPEEIAKDITLHPDYKAKLEEQKTIAFNQAVSRVNREYGFTTFEEGKQFVENWRGYKPPEPKEGESEALTHAKAENANLQKQIDKLNKESKEREKRDAELTVKSLIEKNYLKSGGIPDTEESQIAKSAVNLIYNEYKFSRSEDGSVFYTQDGKTIEDIAKEFLKKTPIYQNKQQGKAPKIDGQQTPPKPGWRERYKNNKFGISE